MGCILLLTKLTDGRHRSSPANGFDITCAALFSVPQLEFDAEMTIKNVASLLEEKRNSCCKINVTKKLVFRFPRFPFFLVRNNGPAWIAGDKRRDSKRVISTSWFRVHIYHSSCWNSRLFAVVNFPLSTASASSKNLDLWAPRIDLLAVARLFRSYSQSVIPSCYRMANFRYLKAFFFFLQQHV